MKSNKRTEKSSTEIATREEFPLELVAATAVHFLDENRPYSRSADLRYAAETAIRFLKICADSIESHQRGVTIQRTMLNEFKRLGWKHSDTIPYKDGIKFITGQNRRDRAQEDYETFLKNNFGLQKPLASSELAPALKKVEKEGFLAQQLFWQRSMFEQIRTSLKRVKKIRKT
jgi:hypothetical protein